MLVAGFCSSLHVVGDDVQGTVTMVMIDGDDGDDSDNGDQSNNLLYWIITSKYIITIYLDCSDRPSSPCKFRADS